MSHADNVRRNYPAVRQGTYLNTGTFGLLADRSVAVMKDTLDWMLNEGRRKDNYTELLLDTQQQVRQAFAHLFCATADEFVLTESTTHGINIVVNGLPLFPGDEVITTEIEHEGALLPLFVQKQKRGVVLKYVKGTASSEEVVESVEKALTPRTKLIMVSHVSYATGHRLPVERLAKLARDRGIWMLVDGAQAAGAEPIDLPKMGVDFYAFPGHKWLCGPDGTGGLFVAKEVQSVLQSTYVGSPTLHTSTSIHSNGTFLSPNTARRFEHSAVNLPAWRGLLDSLQMLRVTVGWDYVFTRIQGLTSTLIDQLLDIPGTRIVTPREGRAGLVHVFVEKTDTGALHQTLMQRGIHVKAFSESQILRISPHFYNLEDEIERFTKALTQRSTL
jgi:L-cysteine/cystine lyase